MMQDRRGLYNTSELLEFVKHSNRIEGEPDSPGHALFDDHYRAAQYVASRATSVDGRKRTRGTVTDPLNIHRILMASQPWKFPGEMRQVPVFVGGQRKMHVLDIRDALSNLEKRAKDYVYYKNPSKATLWDLHYEFESIHPFQDGNGRTGRLWLNSLRLVAGYPWYTVRFEDRFEYYNEIRSWETLHERLAR